MPIVYVSIGSNIDPDSNFRSAVRRMAEPIRAVSTIYQTKPLGRLEQPDFYNGVIEIGTDMPASKLRELLKRIEVDLGRVRGQDKCAARTIDLDIIVYEGEPADPDIADRPFLSIPLFELAPDMVILGLGPVKEIAAKHQEHDMTPLPEFTELVRKDIEHEQRKSPRTHKRASGGDR